MDCCVVVVHWGSIEQTQNTVLSCVDSGLFSNVVVVSNDLTDCPPALRREDVQWNVPSRNLGYGAGCQYAVDRYRADSYLFLNPDVTIKDEAIAKCLDTLINSDADIVAPTLVSLNGSLQSGCGYLSRVTKDPRCDRVASTKLQSCDWVTGAAIFCLGEVARIIRWDGSYFLDAEDVDFCIRTRNAGWKVLLLSEVIAVHPGRTSYTGALPVYYGARNRIWLSRRHQANWRSLLVTIRLSAITLRLLVVDILRWRPSRARLSMHGSFDGWRYLPESMEPLQTEPIPSRWITWE